MGEAEPDRKSVSVSVNVSVNDNDKVRCPFCGLDDTELYALFGSQLSTSQYYCRRCRVAFEAIKWESSSSPDPGGRT